jgi:hypothetical protein
MINAAASAAPMLKNSFLPIVIFLTIQQSPNS